jgi:hypothetical protein
MKIVDYVSAHIDIALKFYEKILHFYEKINETKYLYLNIIRQK